MAESSLLPFRSSCAKNPNPQFSAPEGKETLDFNRKLMRAAENFTSKFVFIMLVAFARQRGVRRRMPPADRLKAINALMQGICFHYDPLANRVNVSLTTLAMECGLATEKKKLSICRATRALQFLRLLGLITYKTEFCSTLGCNFPTDISFENEMFRVLEVSERAVEGACRSRLGWKNQQRAKRGLAALSFEEARKNAWGAMRGLFYKTRLKRKQQGEIRAQAKRDSEKNRQQIEALVRRQLTAEIATGAFPANREAVMAEVALRVKQRMVRSRGQYSRLATT
ncbi:MULTISPECIES: plasmid replication initiator RepA [Enterobacterales]|uniref:plasmid replication initiator RepA n=1 Tax=Enterobacterales TaxID=91347 RepID=UPI0003BEFF9F|nr:MULTISPECIES: plasmid replication initiator RepA [Enterobacteriaceae]EFA0779052.1 incFII family plasmid replication initiator RepA [Escherichia coli]EFF9667455.1 incFII family plasmid replication initiator RepA [Escherichia coli]EKJ3355986.1 incFII family plasmid replication initiator RepA [Escherichia coli]ELS5398250.1 incFII family plasmid replication initiator RepA [Escherichia coli]ESN47711.1 incFII family plasmid replication initiator RepA [Klebsiella pneumoniae MGH 17]